MVQDNLLTPDELSKKLKISKAHILMLVRKNQIPYIPISFSKKKRVRFDVNEIDEWLQSKKMAMKQKTIKPPKIKIIGVD